MIDLKLKPVMLEIAESVKPMTMEEKEQAIESGNFTMKVLNFIEYFNVNLNDYDSIDKVRFIAEHVNSIDDLIIIDNDLGYNGDSLTKIYKMLLSKNIIQRNARSNSGV
ncbi:MAG: hypothetical protein VKL60_20685 [Sphaerospermopsis sp.]|nr:hypothetical protein [Sphaerospermopsis sp.]